MLKTLGAVCFWGFYLLFIECLTDHYYKWGNFINMIKILSTPLNFIGDLWFLFTFEDKLKINPMKKVEAIIRKSKFSSVKKALHEVGINFFSYWDVTGLGNEKEGHVYRGVSYSTSDIQRRYLSIVVNDDYEEVTINAILTAGSTGDVGDGKIFVSQIDEVYRIRTGEKGGNTLK